MGQVAFERVEESGVFKIANGTIERVEPARAAGPAQAGQESELVAGLIANDARAWREFQRRYDRLILRCITKVTKRFAVISQEDIREIYATLLMSLLANDKVKLRTFDPARGNRFSSWIGLLAIHSAYDYLRTIKREPPKEVLEEAVDLSTDLPDPFEQTAQRQRAELASKVLAGFSKKDRAFAALYFGEGMAPDQIAQRLKISVKTVYSKKHKIQTRLEAIMAELRSDTAAA